MNIVMVKFNKTVKTSVQVRSLLSEKIKTEDILTIEAKYTDMMDGMFAVEVVGDVDKISALFEEIKDVQYAHPPQVKKL